MKRMKRALLVGAIGIACAAGSVQAVTLHVDASASLGGNGLAWNSAFKFLQDALDKARVDGQYDLILVAEGTYYPDEDEDSDSDTFPEHTDDDRNETFTLVDDVFVQGGYEVGGSDDADPERRDTILNGDLQQDDAAEFVNYTDNSYHVVFYEEGENAPSLHGFIIRGGNADHDSDGDHQIGGGICLIKGTHGDVGVDIRFCTIELNRAIGGGGGVFLGEIQEVIFKHCRIQDNIRTDEEAGYGGGGGMNAFGSEVFILHCSFDRNVSERGGGGGLLSALLEPHVISCGFAANVALDGNGGGYASDGYGELVNCVFTGNEAIDDGDDGNDGNGGGVYQVHSLINCTIVGNDARRGGGVYDAEVIHNSIIYSNTADLQLNCGNTPAPMSEQIASSTNPTYSCIEDWVFCCPIGPCTDNTNNFDDDPKFRDTAGAVDGQGADDTWGTTDDDVRLADDSPCLDSGNNSPVPADIHSVDDDSDVAEPTPDRALHVRIFNSVVDRGAYELSDCQFNINDTFDECIVNGLDLAALLGQWTGMEVYPGCPSTYNFADFNEDCKVNGLDLAMLLGGWGPCREGSCEESFMFGGGGEGGYSSVPLDDYAQFALWILSGDYTSLWEWFDSLIYPK